MEVSAPYLTFPHITMFLVLFGGVKQYCLKVFCLASLFRFLLEKGGIYWVVFYVSAHLYFLVTGCFSSQYEVHERKKIEKSCFHVIPLIPSPYLYIAFPTCF